MENKNNKKWTCNNNTKNNKKKIQALMNMLIQMKLFMIQNKKWNKWAMRKALMTMKYKLKSILVLKKWKKMKKIKESKVWKVWVKNQNRNKNINKVIRIWKIWCKTLVSVSNKILFFYWIKIINKQIKIY